jgi:hypothetical protein
MLLGRGGFGFVLGATGTRRTSSGRRGRQDITWQHEQHALDAFRGLRAVVGDVIAQAVARQKASLGLQYARAVLQHLGGAKVEDYETDPSLKIELHR